MRDSQSSATEVGDYRKTSKGAVILPQAMREVQAIGVADREKLSKGDGRLTGSVTWFTETQSGFCKLNEGRGEVLWPLSRLFYVECGVMAP